MTTEFAFAIAFHLTAWAMFAVVVHDVAQPQPAPAPLPCLDYRRAVLCNRN